MALQLRPNCELCDIDLPPTATAARICSYECTFCASCVADRLHNVCPNCGGGFVPRPIRPSTAWRDGTSVTHQPPSTRRILTSTTTEELATHAARIRHIPPERR